MVIFEMASMNHVAHNLEGVERTEDISTREDVTFTELLLSKNTIAGLKTCGFNKPSPIQLKALPLGKCGFDLIVEAKSGTGKTAVFTIIALEMIVTSAHCQVIILAPTREIASQIGQVIRSIGYAFEGLQVEVVMGGTSMSEDINRLVNNKYQILVGSPGRMKHLIKANIVPLETVRLFVLDEADKLMEECFQNDVNYIFSMLPPRKQVIVASATYTQELRDFLSAYMRSPSHICPYTSSILIGVNQFSSAVPSHLNSFRQNLINFTELKKILSEVPYKQCLVFCNYQSRTRSVYKELCCSGWPAEYLCSSQTQCERLMSLHKLQDFRCRVLVATDLAARGIDAANVDLVVNLEMPHDLSTYLHRIGRAGRYGSKGTAITIVPINQNEKFLSLFENFGNNLEIKPLRSLSSDILAAKENSNILCKPNIEVEEKKDCSMLPLMVAAQKCEITVNNFDTLMSSFNNFENPLHVTFDSLLDSMNCFNGSGDKLVESKPSNSKGPNCDILKHIDSVIKNIESPTSLSTNGFKGAHRESPVKITKNKTDVSHTELSDTYNLNKHTEDLPTASDKSKSFIINNDNTTRSSTIYNNYLDENIDKQSNENFYSSVGKFEPVLKVHKKGKLGNSKPIHCDNFSVSSRDMCEDNARNYLKWKSELSLMSQYIQQHVYVNTLAELNRSN